MKVLLGDEDGTRASRSVGLRPPRKSATTPVAWPPASAEADGGLDVKDAPEDVLSAPAATLALEAAELPAEPTASAAPQTPAAPAVEAPASAAAAPVVSHRKQHGRRRGDAEAVGRGHCRAVACANAVKEACPGNAAVASNAPARRRSSSGTNPVFLGNAAVGFRAGAAVAGHLKAYAPPPGQWFIPEWGPLETTSVDEVLLLDTLVRMDASMQRLRSIQQCFVSIVERACRLVLGSHFDGLTLVGSAALSVETPGSDVDLVCFTRGWSEMPGSSGGTLHKVKDELMSMLKRPDVGLPLARALVRHIAMGADGAESTAARAGDLVDSSDDSDHGGMRFVGALPEGISKEFVRDAPADTWIRPRKGDEVAVRFSGKLEATGVEFMTTSVDHEPDTFILEAGKMPRGWELALPTMRIGEISRFTMTPEFAYGDLGSPPMVPGGAVVIFEFELVDFVRRLDLFRDGSVIAVRRRDGTGKRAKRGDEMLVSLKVTASDGVTSLEERKEVEYSIGAETFGPLGRAVDKALMLMKPESVMSLSCSEAYAHGVDQHGAVVVEVSLIDIFETDNVSWYSNAPVFKKRIRQGVESEAPGEGDRVRLRVMTATVAPEIAVETTTCSADVLRQTPQTALPGFTGPTVLDFVWGNGEVSSVLEMAVAKMSVSERAVITCSDKLFGPEPRLGLVGRSEGVSANIALTTELVEVEAVPHRETPQSTFEFALSRKEVGGRLFKEGKFELALRRYDFVCQELHDSGRWAPDLVAKAEELVRTCRLNIAACMLRLNDFHGVIRVAGDILAKNACNTKALFRRASAYVGVKDYVAAICDLTRAAELEPQNVEVRKLLQQAKSSQREENKQSKALFAKMCGDERSS
eukprot:TRINITY_DN16627_c0_g1_i3.p1 TRINITY_DN16627_c0_g1~~TRINITY_DN16627_c0_g1_i3.p1  ORF type:complete len:925 (-),score=176.26 TRINITY_DN16627_c0_g1_i3:75-2675(-)